ncbi:MAG: UDP-N-acetylmuramoyl-tripeptide--D-alanyl-D-alanine ligase [Planctomycetota bacterium]
MPTIHDLATAIGGQLSTLRPRDEVAQLPLGAVNSDSRTIAPGEVFWALRGPYHDGAAYVEAAHERGAVAAVVGRGAASLSKHVVIEVDDSLEALRAWARARRQHFSGTAIAVTGSVGKTTTRQMIHTVLQTRLRGTSSPRNYNNAIGVPLSMTAIEPEHDYAVLELGATHRGEIASLAELCAPKVGVITQVADAHLGEFGSRRAIAEAKAELLAALPEEGRAVLGDDPALRTLAVASRAEITWVGETEACDVRATEVTSRSGLLSFVVARQRFELPVWGRHHLRAALTAVAVGRMMGFDLEETAEALHGYCPVPQRCEVIEVRGATIINDTYNASPTAVRAALELLADVDATGRRIVVCGDMADLGNDAAELHWNLGEQVATISKADLLFACGQFARCVVSGARAAGMPRSRSVPCDNVDSALPFLGQAILPGDAVLVKGSRKMEMERVVEALRSYPRRRSA